MLQFSEQSVTGIRGLGKKGREAMSAFVVSEQFSARTEVKKSVFIATVRETRSEAEALSFISELKKQYWDARHNCYAYVIGENDEIRRFSDDKEPQGTAGKPILDVLSGSGFKNTAVVVTRYFGGILLGTGGLVRAYSHAAAEALAGVPSLPLKKGHLVRVSCDYGAAGKLQYLFNSGQIPLFDTRYEETVTFSLALSEETGQETLKKITEAAAGAASVTMEDSVYYTVNGTKAELYSF